MCAFVNYSNKDSKGGPCGPGLVQALVNFFKTLSRCVVRYLVCSASSGFRVDVCSCWCLIGRYLASRFLARELGIILVRTWLSWFGICLIAVQHSDNGLNARCFLDDASHK